MTSPAEGQRDELLKNRRWSYLNSDGCRRSLQQNVADQEACRRVGCEGQRRRRVSDVVRLAASVVAEFGLAVCDDDGVGLEIGRVRGV